MAEIPEKFWNVVLEEDGDKLDRSREKWRNIAKGPAQQYPTNN